MKKLGKIIVVGGVSGVGKTTISKLLAKKMELPFYDADDFHPEANVQKMKAGHALNDADRKPWLLTLARNISEWENEKGAILACSALKESYRELLQQGAGRQIIWIFLEGSEQLIAERLSDRKGHFFDAHLLKSQFEAYKRPSYGFYIDVAPAPEIIADNIINVLTGKSSFGIMGAGVKGIQLARKLGRQQLKLSLFDPKPTESKDSLVAQQIKKYPELAIAEGFTALSEFVKSIEKPRKIVFMSSPDQTINLMKKLEPLLENADILINVPNIDDGDHNHLIDSLKEKDVRFCIKGNYENWPNKATINTETPEIWEGFQTIVSFLRKKG